MDTTTNETTEKKEVEEKLSPKEYKVIIDMIHEMDEQYKVLKETTVNIIVNENHLKEDIIDAILPYNKDSIASLDAEEIRSFLIKYAEDEEKEHLSNMSDEDLRAEMKEIKDATLVLLTAEEESKKLKEESSEVLEEYFNYMSSDKVKAVREKRLEAMKKAYELEKDEIKKKKIQNMIDSIESAMNYSFMEDRFKSLGDKEIESIIAGFFSPKKGMYMIQRFKERIKKFGFNDNIFKYFFNIEETFLPDEYHPFNNVFLFIYMRMVAYSDPYDRKDKMFVQSITGALANLVYHKFTNAENEQVFINTICHILDYFNDKKDFFIENNTTYENHPARIKLENARKERLKQELIEKLDNMKLTNYSVDDSYEQLKEYYDTEMERLKNEQLHTENDGGSDEDDEESSIPELKPVIKKEEN